MVDSFFEKLKKGMGITEVLPEEKETMEEPRKRRIKTSGRRKIIEEEDLSSSPAEPEVEKKIITPKVERPQIIEEKIEISKPVIKEEDKEKWPAFSGEPEGELAIDVYQTESHLVIQSAIAGVKPEFLDISMERDIIAIKGRREKPFEEGGDYFTQECYWGPFSREIILPVEVDPDRAEATMKEGILTIRIPKILREKKRMIKVRA